MGKFYVQSGSRWMIVEAMDAEAAGLHLIDRVMRSQLWIYDDTGLTDAERHAHVAVEALLNLAPEIRVSERGLNREDATVLGTPEVLRHWHASMTSLSQLFRSAGLPPRSLCM